MDEILFEVIKMKFCQNCGKELLDQAVICPGCGCSVATEAKPAVEIVPKKAKTAFVMGILSLVLLYPLGIAAIILANQSKAETGGVMCKKAKSGMICGIIALGIFAVNLILLFSGMM